jgi:hypothetical protein
MGNKFAKTKKYVITTESRQELQTPQSNINNIADNFVIAMYDYNAKRKGNLSFTKGEILEIIDKNKSNCWRAKRIENGEVGNIPSNYVEFIHNTSEE